MGLQIFEPYIRAHLSSSLGQPFDLPKTDIRSTCYMATKGCQMGGLARMVFFMVTINLSGHYARAWHSRWPFASRTGSVEHGQV
jgi:hypothetical protein